MTNYVMELKIKNDIYINGDNNIDTDSGKSVITYYYPPLEIPTQVCTHHFLFIISHFRIVQ